MSAMHHSAPPAHRRCDAPAERNRSRRVGGRLVRRSPGGCLCLAMLVAATGVKAFERDLFDAEQAFKDGLAGWAERLTADVLEREPDAPALRSTALDLHFTSIQAQGDSERLLRSVRERSNRAATEAERTVLLLWEARALVAAERADEAVELLRARRQAEGVDAGPRLVLAWPRTLQAAGELEASLAAYEALDPAPLTAEERAQAILEQARLLEQLGRLPEAEARVQALLDGATEADGLPPRLRDASRLFLALAAMSDQRHAEAEALLTTLCQDESADPDHRAAAWAARAAIAEAAGEGPAAVAALSAAVELAAAPETRYAVRRGQAHLLMRLGQLDAAEEAVRELAALGPRRHATAASTLALAEAHFAQGAFDGAHRRAQAVIESTTDVRVEAHAQRIRGEALWELGRPAEAAVALTRAAESTPTPSVRETLLPRVAQAQRDAGQHAQAVETLRRFREMFPESEEAPQAALSEGDSLTRIAPDRAEAHFMTIAEAYAETPASATAWFRAAELAAERDALALAIERYGQAERHRAADPTLRAAASVGLGLLRFRAFEFEQAVEHFERAIAFGGPAGEQAEFLRAAALYNVGHEQAALEACQAFLERRPDSIWAPDVTFWLGTHHFNRRQFERAVHAFQRFAEKWPQRPERDGALLWLARAHFNQRQFGEASAAASQLIREHPASPLLAEARMVHGEALCERMRFDEAILVFDEFLALHPRSPWVAQALGRKGDSLFVLGSDDAARYRESIATYQALLMLPDLPLDMRLQAAYKIGRCHERKGQMEDALRQYYRGVVLRFAEARESGLWPNERARAWYARGALSAADLFEQREDWSAAAAVLERLSHEDTPSRSEAVERARRLRQAASLRR